jgi:hypothetical protein
LPGELPEPKRPLSAFLADLAAKLPEDYITVRRLLKDVGEQGLLVTAMILTIPFLLPVSIPGMSTPFGIVIALAGVTRAVHRLPWLPRFVLRRRIPTRRLAPVLARGSSLCARLERLIHPRLLILTHGRGPDIWNGALLSLCGVLLAMPLPIPFTNTIPAWAALLLAIGIAERDGVFLLTGYAMLLASIVFFITIALGGVAIEHEIRALVGRE